MPSAVLEFAPGNKKIAIRRMDESETLVVTKRGKPVAKVVPADQSARESLLGSVTILGDIVAPIDEEWDVDK